MIARAVQREGTLFEEVVVYMCRLPLHSMHPHFGEIHHHHGTRACTICTPRCMRLEGDFSFRSLHLQHQVYILDWQFRDCAYQLSISSTRYLTTGGHFSTINRTKLLFQSRRAFDIFDHIVQWIYQNVDRIDVSFDQLILDGVQLRVTTWLKHCATISHARIAKVS